jgi:hypothetical protein
LILNVVLVGALVVSHESDQIEMPLNHVWRMKVGFRKGQGGSARSMDASTLMWLNGCFVDTWTTNTCFCMEVSKYGRPFTHVGGPRQQNHHVMNVWILNNHIQGKSRMKKRPFIKWKESRIRMGWIPSPNTTNEIG